MKDIYKIKFRGKSIGALGNVSESQVLRVTATSARAALLQAYDTHEHLTFWEVTNPLGQVEIKSK